LLQKQKHTLQQQQQQQQKGSAVETPAGAALHQHREPAAVM
jgi:hypothetical protein